jgi:hypothetical protein
LMRISPHPQSRNNSLKPFVPSRKEQSFLRFRL